MDTPAAATNDPRPTCQPASDAPAQPAPNPYQALLHAMDQGFCVVEVLFDEAGVQAVDFRYLELNLVFAQQWGLSAGAQGRTARELLPGLEPFWFETYGRVALMGEPARVERFVPAVGRWFDVHALRVGAPAARQVAVLFADITPHKQAEEALRASEAWFRAVANLVPDLLWRSSSGSDPTWYNQRWYEYTGQTPDQAAGYGWTNVLHPDDREESVRRYRAAVATGQPLQQEHRIRSAQGEYRWFQVQARPLLSEHGTVVAWYGAATDIHARKLVEEALRASEEKFRTLFETIDEGFCVQELVFDPGGQVVDLVYREANAAFEQHTGLAEANGKRASEVFPHIEPYWFDALTRVYQTGVMERTEGYNADTGRWLTSQYLRIGGAGSPFIAAVFSDITVRKHHEQRQAFLLKFSDALRAEEYVDAVAHRALGLLSEELGLDRCYLTTYYLDDNRADVDYQFGNDTVPPLPDYFVLSDYPEALALTFTKTVVIEDDWERQGLSEAERRNSQQLGMRALLAATLRKEGKPLWSLAAISARPRCWTPGEIALVEEVAERTWAALERARAEQALAASEEQYRTLFSSMDEGFCTVQVELDAQGRGVDYRFLETNPAFVRQTGLVDAVGRSMRELAPAHEQFWFDTYAHVARTGEARRFEHEAAALGRHYDVYAFRIGNPTEHRVAVLFQDILQRKLAEDARRASEEQLARFNQQLEQVVAERTHELRESRDWLQSVFDTSLVAMSVMEAVRDEAGDIRDFRLLAVNQELERQTGRRDLVGRLYAQEYPGIVAVGIYELLLRTVATGQPQALEYYYDYEGFDRWFACQFVKLGDGVVATNLDITARKHAETDNLQLRLTQQHALFEAVQAAQEAERGRIAEGLHNGVGQTLYAAKLQFDQARAYMPDEAWQQATKLLVDAIRQTRAISHELVPMVLNEFGLQPALTDICRTLSSPHLRFSCDLDLAELTQPLPASLQLAVYRIAQELAQNIVKHAQASEATLALEAVPGFLLLRAEDNGVGFSPVTADSPGLGLRSIRDRVALLGGTVDSGSAARVGTYVRIRLPLPHAGHE